VHLHCNAHTDINMGIPRGNTPRPGLAQRLREEDADLAALQLKRERTLERVRRHRARMRALTESTSNDNHIVHEREEEFIRTSLKNSVRRLVTSVQPILAGCLGPRSRQALFEKMLSHPTIVPHLPQYYLPPKDAVAQQLVIEGLKADLEGVKGGQSKDKLAWKGTILSSTVSQRHAHNNSIPVSALARVLNTNRGNIHLAVKRRITDSEEGSASQWAPLTRKRRPERIDEETKAAALHWWNQETRVSPIQKEVVSKRIGRNQRTQHAMHYLLENQVSYHPWTVAFYLSLTGSFHCQRSCCFELLE
jgi:hypothetical protein